MSFLTSVFKYPYLILTLPSPPQTSFQSSLGVISHSFRVVLKLRTACVKLKVTVCLFGINVHQMKSSDVRQAGLIISKINFSEFEYHKLTEGDNQMNTLNKSIQNFQEYLKIFSSGIEKGAHLTRLAVQEPLGRSHERMRHYQNQNLSNIFFI